VSNAVAGFFARQLAGMAVADAGKLPRP